MEGRKEAGSSSSSFPSELFGSKETSPSSAGVFGSIFAPSSKVLGRESVRYETKWKKQESPNETWKPKLESPDDNICNKIYEEESQSMKNGDLSFIYQEQKVQPCHLSSSIYYGGQDVYSHPQGAQNPASNSVYKKDGGEDDSGSASRGNWWQGSLYY